MDYWEECVRIGLEEAGLLATDEQIKTIVGSVEGGHENYSMAHGYDVADRNYESDEAKELKRLKAEAEKRRIWECSTTPCRSCTTTGIVTDCWGRDMECPNCQGEGRV